MKKLTALFLAVVMVLSVASVALAETLPVPPTTPVPVVLKLKAPAPKALVGKTEAVLAGSLVTSEAVPVADAAITVYRHVTRHGRGKWVVAGDAVTAADGTFSVTVPLVDHGQYRAVFAGSDAYGKKASRVVVTNVPRTRTRR